jgi:hypothetical protein
MNIDDSNPKVNATLMIGSYYPNTGIETKRDSAYDYHPGILIVMLLCAVALANYFSWPMYHPGEFAYSQKQTYASTANKACLVNHSHSAHSDLLNSSDLYTTPAWAIKHTSYSQK